LAPSVSPVRLIHAAPIAELVLDRPDKRNALNNAMWAAIPALVAEIEADPGLRVMIVHGGTSGTFAAGADIAEFETVYATREAAEATAATVAGALDAVAAMTKPSIAAIDGACVGGGVSLALACDLRVAEPDARFGVTPARLGLAYPHDDLRRLVETVGVAPAKDLLFTARLLGAEEAGKMGLVDRLAGDGQAAMEAARELAGQIAGLSQVSVKAAKAGIRAILSGDSQLEAAARARFVDAVEQADFQEGYRAFLEKRTPRFPAT